MNAKKSTKTKRQKNSKALSPLEAIKTLLGGLQMLISRQLATINDPESTMKFEESFVNLIEKIVILAKEHKKSTFGSSKKESINNADKSCIEKFYSSAYGLISKRSLQANDDGCLYQINAVMARHLLENLITRLLLVRNYKDCEFLKHLIGLGSLWVLADREYRSIIVERVSDDNSWIFKHFESLEYNFPWKGLKSIVLKFYSDNEYTLASDNILMTDTAKRIREALNKNYSEKEIFHA